jgi:hypothetical protein
MSLDDAYEKLYRGITNTFGRTAGNSIAYNRQWYSPRNGVPFHFYDPWNQIPQIQRDVIMSSINRANNEVLNPTQNIQMPLPLPQSAQPAPRYEDENEDLYGQPMKQPYFDRNRLQYNPNRTWGEFVQGRGGKKRTKKSRKSKKPRKHRGKTSRRK